MRVLPVSSCLLALVGGALTRTEPCREVEPRVRAIPAAIKSASTAHSIVSESLPRRSELIVAVICIIASLILGPIRDVVLKPNLWEIGVRA